MKESLYWGRYTWVLFHLIAGKIKNEHFAQEINNIKKIIYDICRHLPCPHCRGHAIKHLSQSTEFRKINSKETLKMFLFNFHNIVNKQTNRKIYNVEILAQYNNVSFTQTFNGWLKYFRVYLIDPYNLKEETDRRKMKLLVKDYFTKSFSKYNF